jgi:hypothetical protein
MENSNKEELPIEQAGEELFNFAVDRKDLKTLLAHLPKEAEIERGKVEYELGILRIISVGWSISYFLENSPHRNRLGELYWKAVRDFSLSLSSTAGVMTGQEVNYFQILIDRLDLYVEGLRQNPGAREPAAVMGPEFARICGNADDVYTVMAGTKMFVAVVSSVKEYLEAIRLNLSQVNP